MRILDLTTYDYDNSVIDLNISKEIPYVKYKGNYVRVNVDKDEISPDELSVFPSTLDIDTIETILDISVDEDEEAKRIYYTSEHFETSEKFMNTVTNAASYSEIDTKYLYKTIGIKDSIGNIDFEHYTILAFKMEGLYVPAIVVNDKDLNEKPKLLLDSAISTTLLRAINALNNENLKIDSNMAISINNDNEIRVTSLKKDYTYSKHIIKKLF